MKVVFAVSKQGESITTHHEQSPERTGHPSTTVLLHNHGMLSLMRPLDRAALLNSRLPSTSKELRSVTVAAKEFASYVHGVHIWV
jgi:hypothetical protein